MSATMTEVTETSTIKDLGIDYKNVLKIERNPTNPRISFQNLKGELNFEHVAKLLKEKGRQCPRILIFEKSLVDCGLRFLDIKQVLPHPMISQKKGYYLNITDFATEIF